MMKYTCFVVQPDSKCFVRFSKGDDQWKPHIEAVFPWFGMKYYIVVFFG